MIKDGEEDDEEKIEVIYLLLKRPSFFNTRRFFLLNGWILNLTVLMARKMTRQPKTSCFLALFNALAPPTRDLRNEFNAPG